MVAPVDLSDVRRERPRDPAVPHLASSPTDQQARGCGPRRSPATAGSSVRTGVSHAADSPRPAATEAARDPSDLPITAGATTPVAATTASTASLTRAATQARSSSPPPNRGTVQLIGRTEPPRRSTARPAYIKAQMSKPSGPLRGPDLLQLAPKPSSVSRYGTSAPSRALPQGPTYQPGARSLLGVLTGLAAALAAAIAGAPAAFAQQYPPPGQVSKYEPVAHHFNGITGSMTGWQISLIAVGAAIVGAIVAMLLDRARAARRHRPATA